MQEQEENTVYTVVMNDEEQYSIWMSTLKVPLGWHEVGKIGKKEECLAYIRDAWTDMRPKSLREQMQQNALAN